MNEEQHRLEQQAVPGMPLVDLASHWRGLSN